MIGQVSEICLGQNHHLSQQRPPSDYEKFNYFNQGSFCNFLDIFFNFMGYVFIEN